MNIGIWVVNDLQASFEGKVNLHVYDVTGRSIYEVSYDSHVPGNTAVANLRFSGNYFDLLPNEPITVRLSRSDVTIVSLVTALNVK